MIVYFMVGFSGNIGNIFTFCFVVHKLHILAIFVEVLEGMQSFNTLKKNLKKDFTGFKKVRVAVLSDSASQLLVAALCGYGYEMELDIEIYEAEYNQIDSEIFNAGSGLYLFHPQYVFINRATEKLLNDFYKQPVADRSHFSDDVLHATQGYYDTLQKSLNAKIIINTYPEINDAVFGNYAAKTDVSFIYQLRKVNLSLMEFSQSAKDLYVCDIAGLQSVSGYRFSFDPKMYATSDMVYSLDFLPYIAMHVTDIIQSAEGIFKKCLVIDLDNIVWGGEVGDDGPEGIEIGHLGLGKIFTEIQTWIKELKQRGIIIAVCSKNTESIALEPFLSHPDMVLRQEDIAVFVANWETKVDNIRYIQSALNIGFDAMVFIDDSPFEREMVKSAIPGITVPDLPEDPAEYLVFLRSLNLFETPSYVVDDEQRTQQYRENAQRNTIRHTFENEDDFLSSLEMKAEIKPFDSFTLPRVHQLIQRSNQFNLRTIRYTENELVAMNASPDYYTISLSLEDRLGSYGIVGVVILKREDDATLFIDTWIMSCRVLKRGLENFTLNLIAAIASENNFQKIIGEYLPTKKNGIVQGLYEGLGFNVMDGVWSLDVASYKKLKTFITKES